MDDELQETNGAEASDLGDSYGTLLNQQEWQLDVGEAVEGMENAPAAEPAESLPPPLQRIVEALLFVGGVPLTPTKACETIRGLTPAQFNEAIDTLNHAYRSQGRPYWIQSQDQGYALVLRPKLRPIVERLYGATREARLSTVAIDVLSLVAYRQPASKQEIDALRGADSGALLRQLVRRGLIAVVHRGEAQHQEVLYGTTPRFLELFKLSSLDDLPQTQDLQKL